MVLVGFTFFYPFFIFYFLSFLLPSFLIFLADLWIFCLMPAGFRVIQNWLEVCRFCMKRKM
jgi:hypothetical protein